MSDQSCSSDLSESMILQEPFAWRNLVIPLGEFVFDLLLVLSLLVERKQEKSLVLSQNLPPSLAFRHDVNRRVVDLSQDPFRDSFADLGLLNFIDGEVFDL